MEQHLGIRPENDAEGVLQDMHWAGGMQGYFPTYSLGTIYSAALFDKAKKDLGGFDDEFRKGETSQLLEWLRTNIHSKGHMLDAKDLATKVLGEQPTAKPSARLPQGQVLGHLLDHVLNLLERDRALAQQLHLTDERYDA